MASLIHRAILSDSRPTISASSQLIQPMNVYASQTVTVCRRSVKLYIFNTLLLFLHNYHSGSQDTVIRVGCCVQVAKTFTYLVIGHCLLHYV